MKLKTTFNAWRTAGSFSDRLKPFMFIVVLPPILLLALFGLYAIFRYNYILTFVGLLGLLTLGAMLPLIFMRKRKRKALPQIDEALTEAMETPEYWTPRDRQAQQELLPLVGQLVQSNPDWRAMPDASLEIARGVAMHYGKGKRNAEWAFSPVALLAIAERLTQRYRRTLKDNVPGIDHLKISHVLWLEEKSDQFAPALKLVNIYRKVRLLTPEGLLAELGSQAIGQSFEGLSDEMQIRLKRLLLLEVLRAAVDLYGGHFRFEDDELSVSATTRKDDTRPAEKPEPVRICLIGQVGAGKSSVINALTEGWQAETSALPSTDRGLVYECKVDGIPFLRLLDLPGLNGDPKTEKILFKEMVESDMVLWVLRANQPARKLDQEFGDHFREWRSRHIHYQPPPIIGLLNQVDRLGTLADWNPPYELTEDSAKATLIREALEFNRDVLKLDDILPLSVSPDREQYNVDALRELLKARYDRALNVQLNRRRREAGGFSASREWKRVRQAGSSLFALMNKDREP
ncbi:GTPase family protein [Halopseudomonas sp.]|uniref:GTPase family protein n=1 Tax=Halopseudomonas sp. TaxID=2901191 RepID=UPI003568E804